MLGNGDGNRVFRVLTVEDDAAQLRTLLDILEAERAETPQHCRAQRRSVLCARYGTPTDLFESAVRIGLRLYSGQDAAAVDGTAHRQSTQRSGL